MKKLLTILLALLVVTGVVFADDPPSDPALVYNDSDVEAGDSTLTLKSVVQGVFKHGFARDVSVEGFDYGSYSRDVVVTGLGSDGISLGAQSIGQYYIETNATSVVDVTFTVKAMENKTLNSNYFVAYLFSYEKNAASSGVSRFTVNGSSIELRGAGVDNADLDVYEALVIESSKDGGYGKLVLDLTATFTDNANLPEGEYEGTIVAAITVI